MTTMSMILAQVPLETMTKDSKSNLNCRTKQQTQSSLGSDDSTASSSYATVDDSSDLQDDSEREDEKHAAGTTEGSAVSSESSQQQERRRRVSFGHISIRHYPVIVGNHPDTHEGPPVSSELLVFVPWKLGELKFGQKPLPFALTILSAFMWKLTIGWEILFEVRECMDDFELKHPSNDRRNENELRLDRYQRARMLRRCGISDEEMMEGAKEALLVRKQRHVTLSGLNLSKIHEFNQSVARFMKRTFRGKTASPKLTTKY